jgi:exosortase
LHYVIWGLVGVLYSPIFYSLYRSRWNAVDYTHAYFILPVSLWLVWRKRVHLRELLKKPELTGVLAGLPIFLFGILMFIIGWHQEYLFISTLSLIPVLYGLITYLWGLGIARALPFPILYLLLLVPPPLGIVDNITLPMRYGISVVTETVLRLFHYPITREGLLLSVGGHEIFMGQPCSGFRSLITMFSLAIVYVYLSKGSFAKKIALTFSVVPLALVGNLIRVVTMCLITYHFGESVGHGFFHYFGGVVIFVVMILGLTVLESLLIKRGQIQ